MAFLVHVPYNTMGSHFYTEHINTVFQCVCAAPGLDSGTNLGRKMQIVA